MNTMENPYLFKLFSRKSSVNNYYLLIKWTYFYDWYKWYIIPVEPIRKNGGIASSYKWGRVHEIKNRKKTFVPLYWRVHGHFCFYHCKFPIK